jgi:hypothetical protein
MKKEAGFAPLLQTSAGKKKLDKNTTKGLEYKYGF